MSPSKYYKKHTEITVEIPGEFYPYYLEITYRSRKAILNWRAMLIGSLLYTLYPLAVSLSDKYPLLNFLKTLTNINNILTFILVFEIIPLLTTKLIYIYRLNKDLKEIVLSINTPQNQHTTFCLKGNRIKYLKRRMLNMDKNIVDTTIMISFAALIIGKLQSHPIISDLLNTCLNIEIIQKGVIILSIIYFLYILQLYLNVLGYLVYKLTTKNTRKNNPRSNNKETLREKIKKNIKQKIHKGRERVIICLNEILLTTYKVEKEEEFIIETRSLRESYRARSEEHRMLDSGFKKEQNQTR